MSKIYYVDVPNPYNEEGGMVWINITSFDNEEEALNYVQENFGADSEGNINLISVSEEEDDE